MKLIKLDCFGEINYINIDQIAVIKHPCFDYMAKKYTFVMFIGPSQHCYSGYIPTHRDIEGEVSCDIREIMLVEAHQWIRDNILIHMEVVNE